MKNEVVPEQKPNALKLAALRKSVPAITKAKITDPTMIGQTWKLLNLDYGNLQDVIAKPKEQVRSLKLKATMEPAEIMDIFLQFQVIATKIKAKRGIPLLQYDQEYVGLIRKFFMK